MDPEKEVCCCCEKVIKETDSSYVLGDDQVVCSTCYETKCKECERCNESYLIKDMIHAQYDDEDYCQLCFEEYFAKCDLCGEMVLDDDMTAWGDDMKLCPSCFEKEFPDVDEEKNLEETTPAYEAMLQRLVGRKVANMVDDEYEYDTGMDEDGYRMTFTVSVDENGRICDISRLSRERCRAIWITGEDWHTCEIDPDDYAEDGIIEDAIRTDLDIVDEDDEQ